MNLINISLIFNFLFDKNTNRFVLSFSVISVLNLQKLDPQWLIWQFEFRLEEGHFWNPEILCH